MSYLQKGRVHLCADGGNYPVLILLSKPSAGFVLPDLGDLRTRAVITRDAVQSRPARGAFAAAAGPAGGVHAQVNPRACFIIRVRRPLWVYNGTLLQGFNAFQK